MLIDEIVFMCGAFMLLGFIVGDLVGYWRCRKRNDEVLRTRIWFEGVLKNELEHQRAEQHQDRAQNYAENNHG